MSSATHRAIGANVILEREGRACRLWFASAILVTSLITALPAADAPRPVKVFILAGQSNMEGKAKVALMDYQARQSELRKVYEPFRKDNHWLVRDDVWVKFLDRKGPLTVGFGSPQCIGPELGFGQVVGDLYPEKVLIIKTAWGGKSLYRDFRPPSAGMPAPAMLEAMLRDLQKRKPDATADDVKAAFGASYRAMLAEIDGTLGSIKKLFPDYAGQGYELAGFVWFQGWNDMINSASTAEYASNLTHLIHDVRKDLHSSKLPFVIGQMGVDGAHADSKVKMYKAAQATVAALPEFQETVALVKTDVFWDTDAEAVFKKGWREYLDDWNKVGSDYPYHYLGSARSMLAIGRAFGEAILALRGEKAATR